MKVWVPPTYLLSPGQIKFQVVSSNDSDLVSGPVLFQVLDATGSVTPPPLTVASILPASIPYVPPSNKTEQVDVQDDGFVSGSQIFAVIDEDVPKALPTTFISPQHLSAILSTNDWSEKKLVASLILTDQQGKDTSTVKVIPRNKPDIEVRDNDGNLTVAQFAFFFDSKKNQYALDLGVSDPQVPGGEQPTTGRAKKDTFKRNDRGFQIVLHDPSLDPSLKALSDTSPAFVDVTTEDTNGVRVDQISKVKMTRQKGTPDFYSSDNQVAVVMDSLDDGATADHAGKFFSDNDPKQDGTGSDPTIEGRIGGKVRIRYTNTAKNQPANERVLDICPKSQQRQVRVHLVIVDNSVWNSVNINAMLPTVRDLWSQACVNLLIDGPIQAPLPADPSQLPGLLAPADTPLIPLHDKNGKFIGNQPGSDLSLNMQQIVDLHPNPINDISVYFVNHFVGVDGKIKPDLGRAITDSDHSSPTNQTPTKYLGIAFIGFQNKFDGGKTQNSNGISIAHELAHVILDAGDLQGGPTDPDDINILYTNAQLDPSFLQRRFRPDQLPRVGKSRFSKQVQ